MSLLWKQINEVVFTIVNSWILLTTIIVVPMKFTDLNLVCMSSILVYFPSVTYMGLQLLGVQKESVDFDSWDEMTYRFSLKSTKLSGEESKNSSCKVDTRI